MVDMKFWELNDFRVSLYSGISGVADYKFQIGFLKFYRLRVDFDEIFCVSRFP